MSPSPHHALSTSLPNRYDLDSLTHLDFKTPSSHHTLTRADSPSSPRRRRRLEFAQLNAPSLNSMHTITSAHHHIRVIAIPYSHCRKLACDYTSIEEHGLMVGIGGCRSRRSLPVPPLLIDHSRESRLVGSRKTALALALFVDSFNSCDIGVVSTSTRSQLSNRKLAFSPIPHHPRFVWHLEDPGFGIDAQSRGFALPVPPAAAQRGVECLG
jgi:hypothetical protein